jgi:hypothetical protein
MAEDGVKSVFQGIVVFIEKFVRDHGMWFWLLVCSLGLLISFRMGWSTEEVKTAKAPQIVAVFAWFCFCMFMNATHMQNHALDAVRKGYEYARAKIVQRLKIRNAKKAFEKIMLCNCAERDWLVWYMFVERKTGMFINYLMRSDSGSWTDSVASWITKNYELFEARNRDEDGKPMAFTSTYKLFLFENFNLKSELSTLLDKHPNLREELREIRAAVGESRETCKSEKTLMAQLDRAARDDFTL